MIFFDLFITFFTFGSMGFGGGYVIIPMMQSEVVLNRGWLTLAEFADIVGLSQITPGAIGINAASYIGHHVAGPLGAIVAVLGVAMPSFILVLLVALFFKKFYESDFIQNMLLGIRPVAIGLIASAAFMFFVCHRSVMFEPEL